uniref:CPW-WPC domain-containing protein n=1 Tax=viral metagenome TaxID=1070528 RepID=A0A6C0E3S1_9ZZZZ
MAMNFQKIVLTIAIVLLIITLIFIGFALNKAKQEEQWPPLVGDCPDYWMDLSGNGAMCVNTQSLGKCNIPTEGNKNYMDFTSAAFTGNNSACAKYTWATGCGVTWDGITSGVSNPCAASSESS